MSYGADTLSTIDAMLKDYYLDYTPENVSLKNSPALMLLPKMTEFTGRRVQVPLTVSNPQGISASFATAQKNATPLGVEAFYFNRTPKYASVPVDGQTMLATASSAGSFLNDLVARIDYQRLEVWREFALDVFGDGTGLRAVLASVTIISPSVFEVTLTEPAQVRRFPLNGTYEMGPFVGPSAGVYQVTGVDWDQGKITFTIITGVAPAVSDVVYREGCRGAGLNINGFKAWIPQSLSPVDNFGGVNRNVSRTQLAGNFADYTGAPIEEALVNLASRIGVSGGRPDVAVLHNFTYQQLINQKQGQVRYDNIVMEDYANLSFRAIVVQTDYGEIRCVPDPGQDIGRIDMLQLDTWLLSSLGELPHIVTDDGLYAVRTGNLDQIEVRLRAFAQLICKAPAYNGACIV